MIHHPNNHNQAYILSNASPSPQTQLHSASSQQSFTSQVQQQPQGQQQLISALCSQNSSSPLTAPQTPVQQQPQGELLQGQQFFIGTTPNGQQQILLVRLPNGEFRDVVGPLCDTSKIAALPSTLGLTAAATQVVGQQEQPNRPLKAVARATANQFTSLGTPAANQRTNGTIITSPETPPSSSNSASSLNLSSTSFLSASSTSTPSQQQVGSKSKAPSEEQQQNFGSVQQTPQSWSTVTLMANSSSTSTTSSTTSPSSGNLSNTRLKGEGGGSADPDTVLLQSLGITGADGSGFWRCALGDAGGGAPCTFSSPSRLTFVAHIRKAHHLSRPYRCPAPGCNATFKEKYKLKVHSVVHTRQKVLFDWMSSFLLISFFLILQPFTCDWPGCTARFSQSGHVSRHRKTHIDTPKYGCSWPGCTRSFIQKHTLKNHMMMHRGEKPWVCTIDGCGRSFIEKWKLVKHMKSHSGTGSSGAQVVEVANCSLVVATTSLKTSSTSSSTVVIRTK